MALRSFGLVVVSLALGSVSLACGDKGSGTDDEQAGGSGGSTSSGGSTAGSTSSGGSTNGGTGGSGGSAAPAPVLLHGFDADVEGVLFEDYTPDDPLYANVGADSTATWDEGEGSDGVAGRVRLEMPFSAPNQLADIQFNEPQGDWTGKTLRADVMIESGFSPDPSAPGGAYLFVKTTADYVWARGMPLNLPPASIGTWVNLSFILGSPGQANAGFDETDVLSFGIQFFTGTGSDVGLPTETVAYVDNITIE